MRRLVYLILTLPAVAMAQSWGNVSQPKEEEFTWAKWWIEPIFGGFWMAWTRDDLPLDYAIQCEIMAVIELRHPGGNERDGILGLTTTRGDRLFIGLLGSAYLFLAWIGLFGTSILAPAFLAAAWIAFCFWKV